MRRGGDRRAHPWHRRGQEEGSEHRWEVRRPTEYNGSVSFKLTRRGKVLNFRLTNATLYCQVVAPPGTPKYPDYTKVVTITHAPMTMEKKTNKNPQGKRFEVGDPIYEDRAHEGAYQA